MIDYNITSLCTKVQETLDSNSLTREACEVPIENHD